jgi:hypothetical protein
LGTWRKSYGAEKKIKKSFFIVVYFFVSVTHNAHATDGTQKEKEKEKQTQT